MVISFCKSDMVSLILSHFIQIYTIKALNIKYYGQTKILLK